jgi:diguanylate cyclase (GGDEF)-like protein
MDVDTRFLDRQYDEKFHLLQAPSLFLPDLHYYRIKCGMRGVPVAIAFLDIDKFKDFNTAVGETHVDWHVLPVFMRALESHIYGHGYAYRFGGDEYILLMPNTEASMATEFLLRLMRRIGAIRFYGTELTVTVSIGVSIADRNCHLTDEELRKKAEQAKNFAKKEGRNRIAGYIGRLFDETELRVLSPPSA